MNRKELNVNIANLVVNSYQSLLELEENIELKEKLNKLKEYEI